MNVTEIIDQVMQRTDGITPADADYADRRQRILEYLREIVSEVWFYRQWRWRRRSATITFLANAPTALTPTDFLDIGPYGSLTRSDGVQLEWVPESRIIVSRRGGFTTASPECYSIFGQDDETPFLQLLQIETNNVEIALQLEYETTVPTLVETDEDTIEEINKIPRAYHQLVLVPGLRYKTEASKGDGKSAQSLAEYQRGLKYMTEIERRGKDTLSRLPSFFGEGWYR
jgi:hypothetical protein